MKGGTHVGHVADQIIDSLRVKVNKMNKSGIDIKPQHVRNHLWVFVNCLIENPAFDSQTKETLKTQSAKFGSKCSLPQKFYNEVVRPETGFCQTIMDWAKAKEKIDLGRQVKASGNKKKLFGIPKLEDAN